MKQLLFKAWEDFRGAVRGVENESLQWQTERDGGSLSANVFAVTVIGCVMLSFLEYYGSSSDYEIIAVPLGWFMADAEGFLDSIFKEGRRAELYRLTYWSMTCFVGYFIIPAAYIKFVRGHKLRDYGLRVKGIMDHAWIYVAMYLAVMPFVVAVAFTKAFRRTYPFYENAGESAFDFLGWEFVYAIQFFSLEFFFRGFMIHGVRARLGVYAIVFSVVPYCMIHFGKPLPETIGAIIAGIALGFLSLFTRSVLLGFAIHVSVALSMDAISVTLKWIDQLSMVIR